MKLTYESIKGNTLRVSLGVKPEGANEASNRLQKESPYRKEIEAIVDVTLEGVDENFAIKEVPEIILNNAVGHIKVDIQANLRALGGEGTYEQKYDRMKKALVEKQTFTAELAKARESAKKSVSVLDELLKVYGAVKIAEHFLAIAKDVQEKGNSKELLLEWATKLEKKSGK